MKGSITDLGIDISLRIKKSENEGGIESDF
jgi:hypothetical protein